MGAGFDLLPPSSRSSSPSVHLQQGYQTAADFTARVQISPLPLQLLSECMAISAENGRVEKAARSRQAVACADKSRYLVVALSLCSSADEHTGACAKPYADATKREVPFPFPTRNVFALQPSLGSQSVSCQIPSSSRGRGGRALFLSAPPSPSAVDGTIRCVRATGLVWRTRLSRNTRLLLTPRA
ncbi:hypothetical protein MUK42_19619 [Musa troglodytarum]|uniref:Uncharacterized protein n=1 Tax=Musa troglodytarum TaxID=320322 RepID=A0A9E7G0W2_9LILI|nr:hypothetical protein MUK42_19619 [Musa troglodytarum]